MTKIYVHIGLPKTATTALQQGFFPHIEHDSLAYMGVFQPRGLPQTNLYTELCRAINHGANVAETRARLVAALNAGKSLIFSEEMILVSQPQSGWRDKLANLAQLIDGLDYQLILTVREPAGALFSFYVEFIAGLLKRSGRPHDEVGFLHRAKHDPVLEIFHYRKLLTVLTGLFDQERIHLRPFERIIAGELDDLLQLFELPRDTLPPTLPAANQRRDDGAYVSTGLTLTAGDLLRAKLSCNSPSKSLIGRHLRRHCRSVGKLLRIPVREIKVRKPDHQELAELRRYLAADIAWLFDNYGVDYRSTQSDTPGSKPAAAS